MGAQTIRENSLESILDKIDNYYVCQGEKYILNKEYDVGDKVNLSLFTLVERLDDILTSGACLEEDTDNIIEKINQIITRA